MEEKRLSDYKKIGEEIGSLVEKKQAAYGDSFGKSGAVMRILYPNGVSLEQLDSALTVVRVVDKLFRIATDKDAFGESPWNDIAGYAVLEVAKAKRVEEAEETADKELKPEGAVFVPLSKPPKWESRYAVADLVGTALVEEKSKPTPTPEPEETRFPELESLLGELKEKVSPSPDVISAVGNGGVVWGGIDGYLARRTPFELLTTIAHRGSKQTVEGAVAGVDELVTKAKIFNEATLDTFREKAAKAVELLGDEKVDRGLVAEALQSAYSFLTKVAPHRSTEGGKKWKELEDETIRVALRAVIKVFGIDTGNLRLGENSTDQIAPIFTDNTPAKNTSDPRVTRNKHLVAEWQKKKEQEEGEETESSEYPPVGEIRNAILKSAEEQLEKFPMNLDAKLAKKS